MSLRSPTKAQLRRMIEERLAELRWALKGMEATGNYNAEAREMHQALLAEVDSLNGRYERYLRNPERVVYGSPGILVNAQFCTQTDQICQRTSGRSAFSPPNHRRLIR